MSVYRQAKQMIAANCPARTKWLIGNNRKAANLLVGVLTGYCRLKRNLSIMRIK